MYFTKKRPFLLALLLVIMHITSFAELKSTFQHRSINNSDGLSNGAVTCIYEDGSGYMWFGTWDGLNRYDGSNITVFRPDVFVSGSLSNNIIRNIFEDGNSILWVVTEDGLNCYDRNYETFTSFLTGLNSKPFIENRFKTTLFEDSLVMCAVYGHGLFLFDGSDFNKIKDIDNSSFGNIVGLKYFNNKLYILDDANTLSIYSCRNTSFQYLNSFSIAGGNMSVVSYNRFFTSGDELWLALRYDNGDFILYNTKSGTKYEIKKDDADFLVTAISDVSHDGKIMVGTDAGSVFNINLSNVTEVEDVSENFPEIANRSVKIWCIENDNPDVTWFGTDGYGVMEYYYAGKCFCKIKMGDTSKGMLTHNIIRAVFENSNGDIYVGTRGSGLNCIKKQSNETIVYDKQSGISDNAVLSLAEDKYNNIWIGVDGEGVDMLDVELNHVMHFPRDFYQDDVPEFGHVYSICIDSYGDVWLGTSGNGIVKLEVVRKAAGSYKLVGWQQILSTDDGLQSDIVYSIVEAEPNVLWIGSRGGGVQRYNILTHNFDIYRAQDNLQSITNDDVLTLFMSSTQKLWVGSSGGLTLIDQGSTPYKFVHYNKSKGLPSNTVHAIQQDNNGNIWVSTNDGLSRLDPETGEFWNFNDSDGLGNYEYSDNSSCRGQYSGNLYFGGTNGIDFFNPDDIHLSENNPPLVFTGFFLNQQKQNIGDVLAQNIDHTDNIVLDYNQNFFGFSFTSLNYHNKTKAKYAYKLNDFNNDWVYIKENNIPSFTNVPYGEYSFNVKWTNEDGIWSDEIKQINIVINPPWWLTWWAFVLYFLILLIIGTLIVSFLLLRHKEKTNIKIKEIELSTTKELNQYKLQFFTNIAHEFRTPLTLIMAPAIHLLNLKNNDDSTTPYLKSIYENSRRLQHLIGELTEFRKVETSNKELKVANVDIYNFVKNIYETFLYYANSHGIDFEFKFDSTERKGWIDINVIEKILINLISNAIKFTPSGKKVWVNVVLSNTGMLSVEVKDTGVGFPEQLQSKIFDRFFYVNENTSNQVGKSSGVGLALTRSLVNLHKGKISVKSKPGYGSNFRVEIPISEDVYTDKERESGAMLISNQLDQNISDEFIANEQLFSPSTSAEVSQEKNTTILIADDNPEIRRLVINLLSAEYNFVEAENGKQALSIIKDQDIDLVISDVIMPEMDGLTLCKEIKDGFDTCHTPVILLTAKGNLENRIDGINVGADSYIPKPFDPRHLRARINQLLEVREKLRSVIKDSPNESEHELLGLDDKDAKFMNKLHEYITQNLSNSELNAEMMKDHLGLSKTLLYKKIKALTTLTPHGYLKHCRMKKAGQLLVDSDANVSEIVYAVGFNNRTYFYRAFKEMYNCSPKDYKSKH